MNRDPGWQGSLDRGLSVLARAVLSLVAFPIVAFLAAALAFGALMALGLSENHFEGVVAIATGFGVLAGLAAVVILVRKSGGAFRRVLDLMRSQLPEPVHSCLEFGVLGALIFGGVMVAGILILGHTRPIGWDFNRVVPSMARGFAVFLIVGLPVGLWRKQRRSSSAQ